MSTTKKNHLPRAYALASLSALFFSSALLAEPLLDKSQFLIFPYNQVETIGSQDIPLDFVWSPLGQRTDNSRWSDDGAVIYADANGILLWQTQNGQVTPIPNSSKAVPLIVSNNKVMIWHNAFNNPLDVLPGDGAGVDPLEIYIYNMDPVTGVISAPVVVNSGDAQRMLGANIMATAPITTTSVAYHLITSEVDGAAPYRIYRVTLTGDVQAVSNINEGQSGVGREGARVYGHGTDGTTVFYTLDQARPPENRGQDVFWVDGARAGATTGIWEELASADTEPGVLGSRTMYTSANRVVYEWIIGDTGRSGFNASRNDRTLTITMPGHGFVRNERINITGTIPREPTPADGLDVDINSSYIVNSVISSGQFTVILTEGTGSRQEYDESAGIIASLDQSEHRMIDARRNPFTGFFAEDDQGLDNDITPEQVDYFRFLQISTQTVAGDTRWAFALNREQTAIYAYTLNNLGFQLQYTAQLPNGVRLDEWATVKKINPLDGSAIISSDNIDNVIWVGNIGTALENATLFPASSQAEGMFVSSEQALVWNNAKAPVGPGGVIPDVQLLHYQRSPGAMSATDMTSSIRGKTVLTTPIFSPAIDKWAFKTLEKTGSRATTIRSYGLSTFANRDSDNDGIPDAIEGTLGTNPNASDSDGDGLTDGDEVYPYYVVNGTFTWAEAQADAVARGGRLAVVTNQDEYTGLKRRFKDLTTFDLWLGATDQVAEGSWKWGNGATLNDTEWRKPGLLSWAAYYSDINTIRVPWAVSKPDNFNNADGLILRSDLSFEDRPVTERRGYLIEYARTNPLIPNKESLDTDGDGLPDVIEDLAGTNPVIIDSDADGLTDNDELYPYYVINGSFTRAEAEADALARGGRLATATNQDDYTGLKRRFKDLTAFDLWLGATDQVAEGSWKWGNGATLNDTEWRKPGLLSWAAYYSDISTIPVPWAIGKPDDANNADGLVLRSDLFFEDRPVLERRGYLIEYTRTNPLISDSDGDGRNDFDERRFASDPNVKDSFTGVPILPNPVGNVPFLSIANTYYHLLQDEEGRYLGIMTVKLSTKGAFTYQFKGLNNKIKASGRGAFSGTGAYSGPGPKGLSDVTSLNMQMVQESGIWKMVAVMTRINGKQLGSEGLPPKYGKSKPYPTPGAFTMALPLAGPAVTGVTEPSGEGVATGSIDRAGTVKANYILPNGKRSTSSGPILGNDYTVVHASTSKGSKSALVGAFDMGSPRPSLDYGGTLRLYAEASTVKGQATTAIDQIRLVEGSVYIPPAKGLAPLSNLSLAGWNISFNMLEGAFDGVSKVSAWGANNKIVIPPSPTTASKAGYNPKTGLMTFGHTETDPILNTSTTANGYAVVLQRPDQTRGYYLTQFSSGRLSVTKHDGSAPPLTMISPVARTVPVGASVYNVQVSTPGAWQVVLPENPMVSVGGGVGVGGGAGGEILPEDPWVSVEIVQGGTGQLNGSGNGIVRITVQANPTRPLIWRYLTIEIAGIKHNISQDYMQRR